jgi:anti-sigma regulatory factor (Ser/Thr protein kinase)
MSTGVLRGRPSTEREIKLEATDRAPAEARRFVRHHLVDLGFPKLVDDGILIAAELVTNSFKYAGAHGPIWLAVRLAAGGPVVEVWDCSPELPVLREPDYAAECGRGLHVVAALAAAFDWDAVDGGKVTWALLETGVTAALATRTRSA